MISLNGVEIPVIDGVGEEVLRVRGVSGRGASGRGFRSSLRKRRTWDFRMGPFDAPDADAWTALLRGQGDTWPLAGVSASSTGVQLLGTATWPSIGIPPLQDRGQPMVLSGGGSWATQLGDSWTVAMHRMDNLEWKLWVLTSEGGCWHDGEPAANTSGVSVVDGALTVAPSGPAIASIWALRAAVPDAWVSGLTAYLHAQRAALMPRLTLSGALGEAVVVADVQPASVRAMGPSMAERILSVTLTEV